MHCSKCRKHKPEKAFATFRTRKGELRRRGVCWACRGEYAKKNFDRLQKWRQDYNTKNREKKRQRDLTQKAIAKEFVDRYKNQPCKDCGMTWPPVAMDLDHVGEKTDNVANMVGSGYRLELIFQELLQCEVVCACCHRLRTARRKENLAPQVSLRRS